MSGVDWPALGWAEQVGGRSADSCAARYGCDRSHQD